MDYQEKITKIFEVIFGLTLIIFGTFALYHSFNLNPTLNYKEYEFDLRLKPSNNLDIEDVNYIFNLDKNLLNLTFLIDGNTTEISEDRYLLLRYPKNLAIISYTLINNDQFLGNNSGFYIDHLNDDGLTVFEDLNLLSQETYVNIVFSGKIIPNGRFTFNYIAKFVRSGDDTRTIFYLGDTYSCRDNCIDRKVNSEENIHYDEQEIIEIDTEDNVKYNTFRINAYDKKIEFQKSVWVSLGVGSIVPGISLVILGALPFLMVLLRGLLSLRK